MRALDGRPGEAEERIVASLRLAERAQSPSMDLQALVQLVYLRVEQGRAHEIEAVARAQMQRFPDTPAWRSALAALLAAAGRLDEARRELARLAREDFADVPRDRGWLPTLAFAAEVAHAIGDAATAERIHDLPISHATCGGGSLLLRIVAHHLGCCRDARTRRRRAAYFERALTHCASARVLGPHAARDGRAVRSARRGWTRSGRDLAAAALATARVLGLSITHRAAPDLPHLRAVPRA
jgi:hypothetical protein